MTIHVAIGKSARSNRIVSQQELSFQQLAELLEQTPVHVGKLALAEYLQLKSGSADDKSRAVSDKDTAWFSLASYSKPQRAAAHVLELSAWVGDFDAGTLTAAELAAPLGDCAHIIVSTYSHSPEAPKYRVIVPYARPVSVAEHAQLYDYFAAIYGEELDTSTRDPCRLWFFPSRVADGTHEFHRHDGEGLFDPDQILTSTTEENLDATLPQRASADSVHPNDALAYRPEYEKPTADEVRRMLSYIRIEDAPGKRRGPWLEILQGLHDWDDGGEQGFQLINEWSASQPGYVDEADVRKIWDSCRGKGITIATVIKRAIEGGYTYEDEETVDQEAPQYDPGLPPEVQELLSLDGGVLSIKEQIEAGIGGGQKKAEAALKVLEANLIYVADQQEYYSIYHRALLSKDAIRQLYKAGMPKKADGTKMDPCKLLENSITKRVVSSMGYHPGEGEVYFEHARALANWHHPYNIDPVQPTPYELDLFMQLLRHLFPDPEDKVFSNYLLTFLAHSVQKPGSKISSAPLLFSRETGTGKTTMLYEIPARLFGHLNCTLVTNDEIESGFSDFLAKRHLLHLDEIFMGGMRQAAAAANKFKPVVTNATIKVHPKGFAGYDTTNRLIVTACSNHENAVHLTDYDRRWAIHEVRAGKLDKGFARAWYGFMDSSRGPGVLKHIFLNIPTAGFNPHADAPMTREKRVMIDASLGFEESTIRQALLDRKPPFQFDLFGFDEYHLWLENCTGKKIAPRWAKQWVHSAIPESQHLCRVLFGDAVIRLWICRNASKWKNATLEQIAEHMGVEKIELADEEEAA